MVGHAKDWLGVLMFTKLKITAVNFVKILQQERVIVVIRGAKSATLEQELHTLYAGGLRIFEVTVETPGAIAAVSQVREHLPNNVLLGVGTVLDPGTAALAVEAGAQFVVSPVLLPDIYEVVHANQIPCILGGMTPTEIHKAYQLGCDVVKVFPAITLGVEFIRQLKAPFRGIPVFPTGGITLDNAPAFLAAGAVAVGVGSALVKPEWVEQGNWDALRIEAKKWAKLRLESASISV